MVYCVRKFRSASRRQHKNISTRQLKNFNSADFINDLLSIDLNGIVNNNDDVNLVVDISYFIFHIIYIFIFNSFKEGCPSTSWFSMGPPIKTLVTI